MPGDLEHAPHNKNGADPVGPRRCAATDTPTVRLLSAGGG